MHMHICTCSMYIRLCLPTYQWLICLIVITDTQALTYIVQCMCTLCPYSHLCSIHVLHLLFRGAICAHVISTWAYVISTWAHQWSHIPLKSPLPMINLRLSRGAQMQKGNMSSPLILNHLWAFQMQMSNIMSSPLILNHLWAFQMQMSNMSNSWQMICFWPTHVTSATACTGSCSNSMKIIGSCYQASRKPSSKLKGGKPSAISWRRRNMLWLRHMNSLDLICLKEKQIFAHIHQACHLLSICWASIKKTLSRKGHFSKHWVLERNRKVAKKDQAQGLFPLAWHQVMLQRWTRKVARKVQRAKLHKPRQVDKVQRTTLSQIGTSLHHSTCWSDVAAEQAELIQGSAIEQSWFVLLQSKHLVFVCCLELFLTVCTSATLLTAASHIET